VAIITGSSSGIGRAVSLLYAAQGAKAVCADLAPSARELISTEADINTHESILNSGGRFIFVKADVVKAKDMESLVEATTAEFGRLDM
jgi:NAD(P)-dependent dehydrogenase (short-subunit alcohol dehydrogenase family)